ncbi:MAG: 6-carboxytetrahydropterin synthase [Rhodospirillaceae bacterium]
MTQTVDRFMEFQFVAAQRLSGVPRDHAAARLHGHTFQVRVVLSGEPEPGTGWIIDPAEMRARAGAVIAEVDHRHLNDLPGLENPSTENLARHLQKRLSTVLLGRVSVDIWENPTVGCAVRGPFRKPREPT